ncbi:hypothetical protein TL16_g06126 [Triparma laevis f. inornata]|uniref:Uncharacterized protein n=1 Tax=Triparma laevis f. inornata TaxID=1714386 RepID=A0A9W7EE91_9STRA|nr:hypothetical protein TL16_g06126 [Triparma laevis f. inornata]
MAHSARRAITSTTPLSADKKASSEGQIRGWEWVDERPLLKKTPTSYPEIVFDTEYLDTFTFKTTRPLPPSKKSSIMESYITLMSSCPIKDKKQVILRLSSETGMSRGRLEGIVYLEEKRSSLQRKEPERVHSDLQEHVEKMIAEHSKGLGMDGIRVEEINDFEQEDWKLRTTVDKGFVANDLTDEEVKDLEVKAVEREEDEERVKRKESRKWRDVDLTVEVETSELVKESLDAMKNLPRVKNKSSYVLKNVIDKKAKKRGVQELPDTILLEKEGEKRVVTKEELFKTSWGGKKRRGRLW